MAASLTNRSHAATQGPPATPAPAARTPPGRRGVGVRRQGSGPVDVRGADGAGRGARSGAAGRRQLGAQGGQGGGGAGEAPRGGGGNGCLGRGRRGVRSEPHSSEDAARCGGRWRSGRTVAREAVRCGRLLARAHGDAACRPHPSSAGAQVRGCQQRPLPSLRRLAAGRLTALCQPLSPPQGQVSDYSLRATNCSVCVVRTTSPPTPPGSPLQYLFATDGSRAAALTFCCLVRQ